VVLAALALLFGAAPLLAQTGSIEGTVRNARTSEPVAGARVIIVETTFSAVTNQNGFFRIENVPVGAHTLQALVLGYQSQTFTNARVTAGLPVTVNFQLTPAVINLDAVVVTGVVGATQKAKLPFTVDQISSEDLPVPQTDALSAIQGKIAGAQIVRPSGRPGTAPQVLLRGPTSINASGRSQEPLYVVDGVILGSDLVDIDALDIENIEVVKGAAASSLYGSRAAAGVIQITTRRGSSLPEGQIRFSVRSEFGQNQLPGRYDTNQSHYYALNAAGTAFVDDRGNTDCQFLEMVGGGRCGSPIYAGQKDSVGTADAWNTYVSQPWPGATFDQVAENFRHGVDWSQYVAAEGRSGGTNFHASYSNSKQQGVLPGQTGFIRNNFRVNVDQALGQTVRVGASSMYSQSREDLQQGDIFGITRMPAGSDLHTLNSLDYCAEPDPADCPLWMVPRMIPDPNNPGAFIQDPNDVYMQPDPTNREEQNPLYNPLNLENIGHRGRFLGSANVRVSPVSWMSFDGQVSYDRLDYNSHYYRFKGYKSIDPSTSTQGGGVSRSHSITEAFNASANVTFRYRFGGDLNTTTQFRYLAEYDNYESTNAGGSRMAAAGVPTISNLDPDYLSAGSSFQKERADGYYALTNLDYKDRYIVDAMVRNDGSSLFGPDSRRAWYYRIGGAWRVSQDVAIPGVDELKLRYALGTAGNRPRFTAQYETYSVSGGVVSPVALGNDSLKPEQSTEQEMGIDLLMAGRVALTLNYARTKTTNQILQVPLPGFSGFGSQWQNAGTLSSKSFEATLDLQLVQSRTVGWSVRVLFDRTTNTIDSLAVPAYTTGVGGQGLGGIFFVRQGEAVGTYYGKIHASSCDDLVGLADCSEFRVNSDGLLVWTGGEDLTAANWGTSRTDPFGMNGVNQTLYWGTPFAGWGVDPISGDTTQYLPLGKGIPDYNMSFSTTLRWGGLSIYGLIDMSRGFDVYNQPQQWALFSTNGTGLMDQQDVQDNLQKPLGYYNALYQATGGLSPSSYFIQDGSYAKLREVSVRYRFSRDQLASVGFLRAFDGLSISLIGRNLLTWTPYNSYDPEVGRGGGGVGSAAIARVEGFDYPNFRTYTAAIEVNF